MVTIEDDFIKLFEKLDIKTGSIKSRTIKAWFDTDCADLLKWICSSFTEENYLSSQEEYEYLQLEDVFTDEQLKKKVISVNSKHPDLFEYENNLSCIGTFECLVKVLEKREKDCEHLLNINKALEKTLLNEFSELSLLKQASQQKLSSLQDKTLFFSKNLHEIYREEIIKHQDVNGDQGRFPTNISYVQLTKYEEKFIDISSNIYCQTPLETTISLASVTDDIAELQKRIYQSKVSCLAVEKEIEAVKYIENFLEQYSNGLISPIMNQKNLVIKVDFQKQQQSLMLKTIQEDFIVLSEKIINKPTLEFFDNELNSYQCRLRYLTKVNEFFNRIISFFAVMYNFCLNEKQNMINFRNFLKNLVRSIQNSLFREAKMMKIIDEYRIFCSKDLEIKFQLIDALGLFLLKSSEPLTKISDKYKSIKHDIEAMERIHFGNVNYKCAPLQDQVQTVKALELFLTSGPTCRVITVPHNLQIVLLQVDQCIANQSTSLKSAMKCVKQ